jgi:hypothetical protein
MLHRHPVLLEAVIDLGTLVIYAIYWVAVALLLHELAS